jgi:hypothetical protein
MGRRTWTEAHHMTNPRMNCAWREKQQDLGEKSKKVLKKGGQDLGEDA